MKRLIILCTISGLFVGCAMHKTYYDYSVNVENVGELELKDVSVTSQKGFWTETGYVIPGSVKGVGSPLETPPNDLYTIIMKREDGSIVQNTIDLRSKVEKGFRGWLTFTINDNNGVGYNFKRK